MPSHKAEQGHSVITTTTIITTITIVINIVIFILIVSVPDILVLHCPMAVHMSALKILKSK